MKINAFELLLKQRRFDLIYKYLYVKSPSAYNRSAYLESIRAFNNGYEEIPSDGVPKNSLDDFIQSYDRLILSIKKEGFDASKGVIPMQRDGEISDGGHRLSVCAVENLDVELGESNKSSSYPYTFFKVRKMDKRVMDYGALEYVKVNPNAYIVNLHAVTNPTRDDEVIQILEKYGFIYYQKDVKLSLNGYVNLKKISYGSFWNKEKWIGTAENGYAGALEHAKHTMGKYPCRVFVYVCDDISKVLSAKAEIRDLYNIGNYSVHINDTHEEAVWLAETYFNENSLLWLNNCSYKYEDSVFNKNIEHLKQSIVKAGTSIDDYCAVGSTPLNAFGIRHSNDVDYLTNSSIKPKDDIISPHDSQLKYYPVSIEAIVTDPLYHFYYHGVKIYAIPTALRMKWKRREMKDIKDCLRMLNIYSKTWANSFDRWKIGVWMNMREIKWMVTIYMSIKRFCKKNSNN